MPKAREWSAVADGAICQLRSEGTTWAQIGHVLGLSRNTVIERGRRLRAEAPAKPKILQLLTEIPDDASRGALPAGHPLTWGLLTSEPFPRDNIL